MPAHLYTTATAIAEAGGNIAGWDAARVTRLIRNVSAAIDRVAGGRRFLAYEETIELDGNETRRVARSDGLPILSASSIAVNSDRGRTARAAFSGDFPGYASAGYASSWTGDDLNTSPGAGEWHLRPSGVARWIELSRGVWPSGTANISVTGVFGYVEPSSRKAASTTLAAQLTNSSATVTLTSASGFSPRDVLVIGEGAAAVAVIAQSFNANTVTIDKPTGLFSAAIPAGTVVRSWGSVPPEIEEVATLLCKRKIARDLAAAGGAPVDPSLLRRQRTDGGEWEVFAPAGVTGDASTGRFGIPEVDEILEFYRNDCADAAA